MSTAQASGQATAQDRGLPIAEAAQRLGVSENALRKRAQRGSVAAAKGADGLWYVFLEGMAERNGGQADGQASAPAGGQPADRPGGQDTASPAAGPDRTDELIAALRAEVDFLRAELTARSEELRRKDHIVAGFIGRLPELAPVGDAPAAQPGAPGATERPERPSPIAWRRPPPAEEVPAEEALMLRWRRWWRRVVNG